MERQKILAPENGLVFVMLIDEGILYRRVGGAEVIAEQIAKILDLSGQQNVCVQVVPADAGSYPGLAGGFAIAAIGGQEFAYVDDAYSGDVLECPDEVAAMKRVWVTLQAEALPVGQSRVLLTKALETWEK